ncbi:MULTISPECIES: NapC/NirT family cytochrome c [Deefgea]|uniref:Cytochrome c-type protein NapC n=1 Tax=Deefgea chitinilytica TaxID=570276 RepID=A0ABS2CC02_9NEIS|nr:MULTISPECIES: NapC/NirT family cytochrome c [Deefgea]MBM5571680.1 cytochrome c-type protein NapC [Deefgea chitinilytica]MBM9888915.1 NapC/NirT family cytochrome c [Deefgea sp. CFH1-16]
MSDIPSKPTLKGRLCAVVQKIKAIRLGYIGAIVAFLVGIIFWGGFNTALEMTNTEEFCLSCHEMKSNVYPEYQETVHYTNRSGVRATCPDCHVPHEWGPKMIRKIQASKEVWGKLTGYIDTREKFLDKRIELAENEWKRMKANDSKACRNCHNYEYFDYMEQNSRSANAHQKGLSEGMTCIDCHKGIAHHLPAVNQHVGPDGKGVKPDVMHPTRPKTNGAKATSASEEDMAGIE